MSLCVRHSKNVLFTGLLLITYGAYSAADKNPCVLAAHGLPLDNLIGFSCDHLRGNGLISTACNMKRSPNYSITVVYSEHPVLQIPEHLARIAAILSQQSVSMWHTRFRKLCKNEVAKMIKKPIKTEIDSTIVQEPSEISYDLIALRWTVRAKYMQAIGCILSNKNTVAFSEYSNLRFKRCQSLAATQMGITSSITAVECAQREAERLQSSKPAEPYHVVFNLAAWQKIIELQKQNTKKSHRNLLSLTRGILQ